MRKRVETAAAAGGPTLTQFQNVIRAIVEVNAKSPHERRVLIHDPTGLCKTYVFRGTSPLSFRSRFGRTAIGEKCVPGGQERVIAHSLSICSDWIGKACDD